LYCLSALKSSFHPYIIVIIRTTNIPIYIICIQGGESEIRAKFYSMAFQQSFDEDSSTVQWKVVDYEFAGDIPYY